MTNRDCNDNELIKMAVSGDMDAFGEIYLRYKAYAFEIARKHLGDHHMAEDATQEVFAKLICKLHLFVGNGNFKSFLGSVVRNLCKDIMRRRKMLSLDIVYGSNRDIILVDPKQEQPIEFIVKKEDIEAVRLATDKLPVIYSSMIKSYWYDEMKLSEVAYKFNLPLGTVKSMIYGVLKKMQNSLGRLKN